MEINVERLTKVLFDITDSVKELREEIEEMIVYEDNIELRFRTNDIVDFVHCYMNENNKLSVAVNASSIEHTLVVFY